MVAEDYRTAQIFNRFLMQRQSYASTDYGIKTLGQIEEELEQHIRFEERQLFNEIQQLANEAQLYIIAKHHVRLQTN